MNRHEFLILFDVKDGNPNGDPDGDNAPRTDPETGHGLVTDVCIKRKIRDRVALVHAGEPGMGIYVQHRAVLAQVKASAYESLGLETVSEPEPDEEDGAEVPPDGEAPAKAKGGGGKGKKGGGGKVVSRRAADFERVERGREYMQKNYWDVRTFGAVMSGKGADCGQVRGPVQLGFARSVDPVLPTQVGLTRCAVETVDESERMGGQNKTMGDKWIIPYGLYVMHGFVSPMLAKRTGFSEADLMKLWQAIVGMFDDDRSAAHGFMAVQGLWVFEHDSELGGAPAHRIFDRILIRRREASNPPRDFKDYEVKILDMPGRVTCRRLA